MRSQAVSHASDEAKTALGRLAHPLDAFYGCQSPNALSTSKMNGSFYHGMMSLPPALCDLQSTGGQSVATNAMPLSPPGRDIARVISIRASSALIIRQRSRYLNRLADTSIRAPDDIYPAVR